MKTSQNSEARRILAAILALAAAGTALPLPAIELVSAKADGMLPDNPSSLPAVSASGRYVAFQSSASDLVAGDTNSADDIFVKDRVTGAIERVSVDASGNEATGMSNGATGSRFPAISDDGRYVAFASAATNLVAGDVNNRSDIFVKDRSTGAVTLVSVTAAGVQADRDCVAPSISGMGRYVAFGSQSTNLGGAPPNGNHNLFLKDLVTGAVEHISLDSDEAALSGSAYDAIVSDDGNRVLFSLEGFGVPSHVFLRDRAAGTTTPVSLNSQGDPGNDRSYTARMSGNGRWIVFLSSATNLVDNDTNFSPDVFVRDLETGITERVSVDSAGNQVATGFYHPDISDDGRFVLFRTDSADLVANDTNGLIDIFLHDRQSGATLRISEADDGSDAESDSTEPVISGSGAVVVFVSGANNLVAGGVNGTRNVLAADNPLFVPIHQPDNRIGATYGSAIGNGIYNASGLSQTLEAVSRKAAVRRTNLHVENDGNVSDLFRVRGSGGDRSFKVAYSAGTNRTAQILAGTHLTATLEPGKSGSLAVTVTPNRKTLLKTTRKAGKVVKKWKRADRRFFLTSTSLGDPLRSDTAVFRVMHR